MTVEAKRADAVVTVGTPFQPLRRPTFQQSAGHILNQSFPGPRSQAGEGVADTRKKPISGREAANNRYVDAAWAIPPLCQRNQSFIAGEERFAIGLNRRRGEGQSSR